MNCRIDRRVFLSGGLVAALPVSPTCGDAIASTPGDVADEGPTVELIAKLKRFLLRSQHEDGSWRSEQYGVLRGGQALTPFVLHALMSVGLSGCKSPSTVKAIEWIRRNLRDGCLGITDPDVLEYPVFATAFAVRCLVAMDDCSDSRPHSHLVDINSARDFLLAQQFDERSGFRPSHLAYGGWGFGGNHPAGETGHMDLAHTRWTLQSLAACGAVDRNSAPKAQRFLRLLQKHPTENRTQPIPDENSLVGPPFDGGFYFSPIVHGANKGRIEKVDERAYFRSYATATCDGVLALLASGVEPSDERVQAARRWLEAHPSWDYPAGIPRAYSEPWGDAVYFYHQAVRAEVYRRLLVGGDWPKRLIARLTKHLCDDGSIVNRRSPLMKEDDPILCTSLALIAATEAMRAAKTS